jgi:hypothetical protein
MLKGELIIQVHDLQWECDWLGFEVGFPDVEEVGQYLFHPTVGASIHFYIDTDNGVILDMWSSCDCDS